MNKEFEVVIKEYLDNRASTDALFAKAYAKENKNIDELRIKVESLVKMIRK